MHSPGPYEGKKLKEIGIVRHSVFPPTEQQGENCHPDHNPNAEKLDIAFAEVLCELDQIRSTAWIPFFTSVRSTKHISKNDTVVIVGKVSGHVEARIGALTMWDEVIFLKMERSKEGLVVLGDYLNSDLWDANTFMNILSETEIQVPA